jgi:hypothetical protein
MKKVVPGQRFSIGANDWNQIADVVNSQSPRMGAGIAGNTSNQYILISNSTDVAITMYGIVELDGLAINPIIQADQYGISVTYQEPVFSAIYPLAEHDNAHTTYAIAQEPIAPGCVGKACINGISLARCAYSSGLGGYIKPNFNNSWVGTVTGGKTQIKIISQTSAPSYNSICVVHISPDVSDSMVPAIIRDNIDGYGYYTVRLYENGFEQASTGNAMMYVPEGAYGLHSRAGMRTYIYKQSNRTITAEIIAEGDDGIDEEEA